MRQANELGDKSVREKKAYGKSGEIISAAPKPIPDEFDDQQFIAQLAVERFVVAILPRAAGLDTRF